MAKIVQRLNDGGGTSYIEYYATASYVRDGSKVTITVRCSLYGYGYVAWAYLNGVDLAHQPASGTVINKTFTYDNAATKTYSFDMKVRLQTASEYPSYYYTNTLTIDVPAYVPPGPEVYVNVDGAWKKASGIYVNVEGTWTPGTLKYNAEGEWK